MSKIKNRGLDQYGAESFEQQQLGTAGAEWVKIENILAKHLCCPLEFFSMKIFCESLGGHGRIAPP